MKGVSDQGPAIVSPGDWNELLTRFPEHTVFHTLPWLGAIAQTHALEMVLLAVMCTGGCAALWPCLVMRKGLLRIIGSPLPGWSTAYMGPLFSPQADVPSTFRSMISHPALKRHAYIACKVLDQNREIDLSSQGFTRIRRYETYHLDLKAGEQALWKNVRHECRRHVRKAQKSGVEVRVESSPDFLDDYWKMTIESFGRSGVRPPHNRALLDHMWRRLRPSSQIHALSAMHEGQRVASIIALCDHAVMYNWGSGSRSGFNHLSAPSLLQWEAIRLALNLGIPTYDMISTSGGAGRFKQGFGPHVVATSTHWERCPSRLLMAVKRRYEGYLRWRMRTTRVRARSASNSHSGGVMAPTSSPVVRGVTGAM